ncbi:uncharacterized protein [Prorops nasuta]|uniref:uncharacterized protein n=1 Tax=Prorops nasuta TaxID=863751 RepID=UPI0034CF3A83
MPRIKRSVRTQTMATWQTRWESLNKARWTYNLVPVLDSWCCITRAPVDNYIAQVMSGHGNFEVYRLKIGKTMRDACIWCNEEGEIDTAEHTLTHCAAWGRERATLIRDCGFQWDIDPRCFITIAAKESNWRAFAKFCGVVMRAKDQWRSEGAPNEGEGRVQNLPMVEE